MRDVRYEEESERRREGYEKMHTENYRVDWENLSYLPTFPKCY